MSKTLTSSSGQQARRSSGRARGVRFALTLALALSVGTGVAGADGATGPDQRESQTRETRDWEEPCNLATCMWYELTCLVDGGTYDIHEDGAGNYVATCKDKE